MMVSGLEPVPLQLAAAFLGLNVAAFALMCIDKRQTWYGRRRVPQRLILWIAAVGGWPGAKLAQKAMQHMELRQPFASNLNLVAVTQVVVLSSLVLFTAAPSREFLTDLREARSEGDAGPRVFGPGAG